ncbi:MAG: AAA family ATPase [Bacteroidales bacterium]|nr:AAA family ATPase [Bacteroidales bacterium]
MTKQDITKSVAICTESVDRFWGIPSENTLKYTPIKICSERDLNYFPIGITIHKGNRGEKDWRITGTDFKSLYADDNPEEHDIMCVRKINSDTFVLSIIKQNTLTYDILKTFFKSNDNYVVIDVDDSFTKSFTNKNIVESFQQIFYGAPGTGKSHIVKQKTQGESVVRTTFHPDSDYSTFVGCYKPTTKHGPRYTSYGEKAVVIKDAEGMELTEDRIVYEFVDQAFLQSYIKAWKFYTETLEGAEPKKQYLIIEEINRGNCAQIFGDLFQLLDRNDYGFSDYYIHADKDIQKHLSEALNNLVIEESYKKKINSMYNEDVVEKVLSGEILLLPNNFYIWATMNTSDQSLFPIDSAFKRRWNWKYRPIVKGRDEEGNELNWKIVVANKEYDWWSFLEKINAVVTSTTNSEDKKLGFFFCKAVDGVISAETFVDKVIFYLWNDVFKNFVFEDSIFNDEEDKSKLEFDKFYTTNPNGETIINEDKVEKFLDNLKVEVIGEAIADEEDEDGNTISSSKRDYTKYSVNGVGRYGKNRLAEKCVKEYIELNPEMSAEEVLQNWKSLGNIVSHFIESSDEYNARTDNNKERSSEIKCGGTKLYVAHDGYGNNGAVERLINAVKNKNWDLKIEVVE